MEKLVEAAMRALPSCPRLVVMRITPLAPRTPKTAVAIDPCALAAYKDGGGVTTRLTGILHGGHTRELTGEHIVDRAYWCAYEVFALH